MPEEPEMHESMRRLYDAALAGKIIAGDYPQAELARALNTSSQRIKNWESRGVSKAGALDAQAQLGISSTYLLEGVGAPWVMAGEKRDLRPLFPPGPDGEESFLSFDEHITTASRQLDRIAASREKVPASIQANETPTGYVRLQLYQGAAGMGDGVVNDDFPEVIREVDVAEWELVRKLGFMPRPGRIQIITGRGPSMRPKIEDGDVVMIDTACNYFDGDDFYLVNIDGETQIKMLQKRGDGLYVVSANDDFPAYRADPETLHVAGKALVGIGFRRL